MPPPASCTYLLAMGWAHSVTANRCPIMLTARAAACRETLRSDIIPNAYLWFTGEAAQEESEEDEGSEDEEDEDDDDDDDEDEQDEEASLPLADLGLPAACQLHGLD